MKYRDWHNGRIRVDTLATVILHVQFIKGVYIINITRPIGKNQAVLRINPVYIL